MTVQGGRERIGERREEQLGRRKGDRTTTSITTQTTGATAAAAGSNHHQPRNMPLLSDSADFSSDGASPSPYGMPPGLESELRRETPSHARRTWKAYHERQALVAEHRQLSRPVSIDPVLWGDLLSGKLAELIEGERNHPRTIVSGGAADRDGGHCLLPGMS